MSDEKITMPNGMVIKKVFVHWSESELINEEMGDDDNGDIDKFIDPIKFNKLISVASQLVPAGYDKTELTIEMENGDLIKDQKFYLTAYRDTLVKLITT